MNKPDHSQATYLTETGELQRRALECSAASGTGPTSKENRACTEHDWKRAQPINITAEG